jgi:hypothetical protein
VIAMRTMLGWIDRRGLLLTSVLLAQLAWAEPLLSQVTVEDGLNPVADEPRTDDYVRLTLINPSYQRMATLSQQIESWLGPGMVRIDSDSLIRVQAPRDPTARVQFIAALLALDLTPRKGEEPQTVALPEP